MHIGTDSIRRGRPNRGDKMMEAWPGTAFLWIADEYWRVRKAQKDYTTYCSRPIFCKKVEYFNSILAGFNLWRLAITTLDEHSPFFHILVWPEILLLYFKK